MGGTVLKVALAGFFVWLAAQMGTFADEILTRVRESVQASELLEIDSYVYYHSAAENERPRAPRDQAEFEAVVREWTSAPGGRDPSRDRWDRPYAYDRVTTPDPRDVVYRIASGGADRRLGTGDDIVVERENDRSRIDRDPARIAEEAIERQQRLDAAVVAKVREVLEAAPPATPAKDVPPEQSSRELAEAVHELARLMDH